MLYLPHSENVISWFPWSHGVPCCAKVGHIFIAICQGLRYRVQLSSYLSHVFVILQALQAHATNATCKRCQLLVKLVLRLVHGGRNGISRFQKSNYCCHMVLILPDRWICFVSLATPEKCCLVLQEECDLGRMADMLFCVKGNVIWATWYICPPCVTRKTIFWTHGKNVPLVCQKKCESGHMIEMLHSGWKCHSKFCARMIYCRHVAVS